MKFFLVALLALFVSFASAYDARQRYTFYSEKGNVILKKTKKAHILFGFLADTNEKSYFCITV